MNVFSTITNFPTTEETSLLWGLLLHDIISPASGLISAASILPDASAEDWPMLAHALDEGGQNLRAHLEYLRLAFASTDACTTGLDRLKSMTEAYFATKKHITFTWAGQPEQNHALPAPAIAQFLFWTTKTHKKLRTVNVRMTGPSLQISCDAPCAEPDDPLYEALHAYIGACLRRQNLVARAQEDGGDAFTIYTLQKSPPET